MSLEDHYSGEEQWKKFLETIRMSRETTEDEQELLNDLLSVCGCSGSAKEILEVACALIGSHRLRSWLERPVPALDGKIPLECFQGGTRFLNRLKEYLMRL